jgi:heat shock protein HslJ
MKLFINLLSGLLAVLLTGCAAAQPAAADPTGKLWKLDSYLDGQGQSANALPDAQATLEFAAGKLSGSTGCNSYFASYQLDGSKLTISPAGSTMMACPDERMTQESAFLAALGRVTAYRLAGGKLELLDTGGKAQLTFSELKPLALAGRTWRMSMVNNGKGGVTSPVVGGAVTAVFGTDGKLSGNGGCNSYGGDYKVDGEKLTISSLVATLMACGDPAMNDQEGAFFKALNQAATYKVSGSALEIRDAGGALLVSFTAVP